ncbi:cdc42 effector protein 5 isoform X1 [Engraulis encrasicolus]|uniref:cdc42 effector protein 5 isoform X1 n=2 Tax=Engraulis encrasicolus TaxID=184585 RepID=UPI002FD040FA
MQAVAMPLHKSQRGRLDPTMISAPLGDFRHTMHIGRGGDAFGDTSFLATQGSASADSSTPLQPGAASDSDALLNHSTTDGNCNSQDSDKLNQLQHSESVSSFDLDLDLGPSILGDVLGVMDGLNLDTDWTTGKDGGDEGEEVFSPTRGALEMETGVDVESTVSSMNEMNEKRRMEGAEGGENGEQGMEQLNDGNGWKAKGLKPKVRFSEKREEIIGQLVEADSPGVEGGEEMEYPVSPTAQVEHGGMGTTASQDKVPGEAEPANHRADSPPSSMSSVSSEYEGVAPLDRRRESEPHSETDSEEEEEEGVDGQRGYTFEDEFDDEIGV